MPKSTKEAEKGEDGRRIAVGFPATGPSRRSRGRKAALGQAEKDKQDALPRPRPARARGHRFAPLPTPLLAPQPRASARSFCAAATARP